MIKDFDIDFDKIKVPNQKGVNYFRWRYNKPCPMPSSDLYAQADLKYNPSHIALLEWKDVGIDEEDFEDYSSSTRIHHLWFANWHLLELKEFIKMYPITMEDIEELKNCNTQILETRTGWIGTMNPSYNGVRIKIGAGVNPDDKVKIIAHELVHTVYRIEGVDLLLTRIFEDIIDEEAQRIVKEEEGLIKTAERLLRKP